MAEYSKMASGSVIVQTTGGPLPVILPFIPNYIAVDNITRLVAGAGVTSASWMTDMGQGAAVINTFGTGAQYVAPVGQTSSGALVSGTGFSTFQAGLALQYGPVYQHTGSTDFSISKANPAVVTTTTAHGLTSGDVVVFSNLAQTSTTGMQQIAGIPFVVTVLSATTFSIPWNTNQSNYTAFNSATSTSNFGSFKQVLYPALYAPSVSIISGITLGTTTVVALTTPGNYSVGQEVAFRIPAIWGTTQLNSLPNVLIPGSPIYGFVTAVSASLTTPTITVNINSSAYTAFASNSLYASYPGEKFAQVVPVGDANSGSLLTNFQSPLFWNGMSSNLVSSINGPAIAGAFCNNTNQGFIIGSSVVGTAADVIYWRAYLHDINT